jgi:hypothetical protein
MGIVRALLVGELLTGGFVLQPTKATLLTRGEQDRHVQHFAGG